ncbi:MAG: hypothetical protein HYU87_11725 [Chloroflexi bacterium]|nr:hypothetical protein [Chloroflexota bacterium]
MARARAGPDGWLGTMVLGIVGSLVGGTLAALIFGGTLDIMSPYATPASSTGS